MIQCCSSCYNYYCCSSSRCCYFSHDHGYKIRMQLGLFFFFLILFFSSISEDMWERYGEAFNKIWAASAFKGMIVHIFVDI